VLAPTRELAMQVSEATHRYGRDLFGPGTAARVLPVYGGQPIGRSCASWSAGVDVVVGTPGRVIDHINRGTLDLSQLRTVVLDEADEMLDMGFAEDIEAILEARPAQRQTVLFSATMPPRVDKIARRHLRNPVRIEIQREQAPTGEAPKVRQSAYVVAAAAQAGALGRVLDVEAPEAAIVFCRTREEVDSLTETLNGRGYRAEALHGGLSQEQRDKVMGRLRGRTADLLVATDVAARGLDVDHLTHVVNYNVPSAPGGVRPPHRPGRPRRPRGRGDHAGRAARAPDAQDHRARDRPEDRRGEGADGRRPAGPPDGADPRRAARGADRGPVRQLPRRARRADRRVRRGPGGARAVKLAHEATVGRPARTPRTSRPRRRARRRPTRRAAEARAGAPGAQEPAGRGPAVHRARARRRSPPAGPRGRDHRGVEPVRPRHRLDRDLGPLRARGGAQAAADEVVQALRKTKIKGRKATVRLDQGPNR
jgi:ATP-dependent RNA helicase DeaD